jgi:NADH/NAD ratio-sensing transcriptional regulator Rex
MAQLHVIPQATPQSIRLWLQHLNVMPSDNDTKSAEELAESTGADSAVIKAEYEAAAELAGVSEESEE